MERELTGVSTARYGSLSQEAEIPAHNRAYPGSRPGGTTRPSEQAFRRDAAATIQRPAKQLRLRCGLGERPSGSLLEFQTLFSCNLLGGYALCIIPVISSGGGK